MPNPRNFIGSSLLICWALLNPASAFAVTYYVNPTTGHDGNDGRTLATAFRTPQRAHDATLPGDVVELLNGRYFDAVYDEKAPYAMLMITRGGTSRAPITYRAHPGHHPVLDTNGTRSRAVVVRASYVNVDGLTIVGNRDHSRVGGSGPLPDVKPHELEYATLTRKLQVLMNQCGISVWAPTNGQTHHVRISNCTISRCSGSAIVLEGNTGPIDYITIRNNHCFDNNQRTNVGSSAINLFMLTDIDKSKKTKIVVENNVCHHNENLLRYHKNGQYTDGNGIIVDVSGVYRGRICLRNNICYFNGGAGIALTAAPNVDVYFNTLYHNAHSPELNYYQNLSVVRSDGSERVVGNIIWAREDRPLYHSDTKNFVENLFYQDNKTAPKLPGAKNVWGRPDFELLPVEGGPDPDFELREGSFGIDQVSSKAVKVDQRGRDRPFDGDGNGKRVRDFGALERSRKPAKVK